MPANKLSSAITMFIAISWCTGLSATPIPKKSEVGLTTQTTIIPAITRAWQTANLFFRSTGVVEKVYYEVGDEVSKNDVLASVNDPTLEAELSLLQAELRRAEVELKLNKLELSRSTRLLNDELISASENDRLKLEVEKSEALIQGIHAKISGNRIQQSFLKIRAPFDGYLVSRNIEKGDLVMKDNKTDNALLQVADLSKLRVEYRVPQALSNHIDKGLRVDFISKSYEQKIQASVDLVSSNIDNTYGTVLVESWIDNKQLDLPGGLRGEVQINY